MKKNVFMGVTTLRGRPLPPQGIFLLVSSYESKLCQKVKNEEKCIHGGYHHKEIKLLPPFEDPLCSKPEFRTKKDKFGFQICILSF